VESEYTRTFSREAAKVVFSAPGRVSEKVGLVVVLHLFYVPTDVDGDRLAGHWIEERFACGLGVEEEAVRQLYALRFGCPLDVFP
jgi:hypothetical protein